MLISICIPCHGRTYDLKKALPSLIEAANASPPVEIMILDYNSPDDLAEFMSYMILAAGLSADDYSFLADGNSLSYRPYKGRDYYHMAHARNLSVLASEGEFVIISCADVIFGPSYLGLVREAVEEGAVWTHNRFHNFVGVLGCRKDEFIAAGGFDERFEFYGKEDKDLLMRLKRRGEKSALMPLNMLGLVSEQTRESKKDRYDFYRPGISQARMARHTRTIYRENMANGVLVANKEGWGQW